MRNKEEPYDQRELLEFVYLILAMALLAWLSLDLTAEGVLGRGNRYLSTEPDAIHMRWLLSNVFSQIVLLGFSGWIALILGRRVRPLLFFFPSLLLWVAIYYIKSNPDEIKYLILLSGILLAIFLTIYIESPKNTARRAPVYPAIYPLFFFLSSLGWLWLLDFSARAMMGPVQWFGLRRWDHMFWAFFAMSMCTGMAPLLLNFTIRFFSWLDTGGPAKHKLHFSKRLAIPVLILLVLGTVIFTFQSLKSSGANTAIHGKTSEILRFFSYILLAWVMFRWGQWENKFRWCIGILGVFLFLLTGFAGTGDFGQVLVIFVAASVLVSGLITAGLRKILGQKSKVSNFLGTAFGILVVISMFALLGKMAPVFSDIPALSHVAKRIIAIQVPFTGGWGCHYLSELRWFMADAPVTGYGLGHAPFCGTLGNFTERCSGLAKETPSDYVFGALAGIFGQASAWLVVCLTALWLLLLSGRSSLPENHPEKNAQQYASWLAIAFSASSLAQLLVTCFGNIGVVPLTGITFPLLSHGGSSLLCAAILTGLVMNQPQTAKKEVSS